MLTLKVGTKNNYHLFFVSFIEPIDGSAHSNRLQNDFRNLCFSIKKRYQGQQRCHMIWDDREINLQPLSFNEKKKISRFAAVQVYSERSRNIFRNLRFVNEKFQC